MTVSALFYGEFILTSNGQGATGLTVTADVERITKSDLSRSTVVTDGAVTELLNGKYAYRLASADLLLYDYIATLKTAATTVVQKHVSGWRGGLAEDMESNYTAARAAKLDFLDVSVDSRLPTASYTAPLSASGTRDALGMAANDLDAQLDSLSTGVGGSLTAAEVWSYHRRRLTQAAAEVL